ncbi:protein kinase domain-containing protein [Calothrix sp. UHCC 0171]|uniref:ATP-binding sensor histidine kinase n=1 Tax=Calothrix sp. UHCC 0171 TaxID=3110245 RepID=UPI002B1F94F8|nr:AAA family ATPase [Calothrix sp. UHCC 0171]MEA5569516.1 AAA family ATPase [Calothrix sp. UHCC 0171]
MPSTLMIPGYEILEVIDEAESTTVCRAKSQKTNQPVILKVLKAEYSSLEQISRIKHEYQTTKNLNLEGVVRVYELETLHNYLVLVAEDFGGISLKKFISKYRNLPIETFLAIALQITKALISLHTNKIIHKDIKPSNIIINPETREVKITDFSIAIRLTQQTTQFNTQVVNSSQLEGTLAYMSPEQTGRMNRCIDYRTDFYSLGVTFYELLTGKLPFSSEEALEVVYGHIAKVPIPVQQLNEIIPNPIAAITAKLMAKNVEDRYQCASGLLVDLQQCLEEYQAKGSISDFVPGERDRLSQLNIPQKLYGREVETQKLSQAFARVSQGSCELVQISGDSGVGKSLLVNEVFSKLTHQRGYFACGKCKQFQDDICLAAPLQILRNLIRQILTDSQDKLALWKEKLLQSFHGNVQVIIDAIPELELLIGKQEVLPQLIPQEELNRYINTVINGIRVFASSEYPLVIFLENIQWSDTASLQFLRLLTSDANSRYILIITSYQNQKVNSTHAWMQTVEAIVATGKIRVESISLNSLAIHQVQEMIAETLNNSVENITPLAKILFEKTQGHPFFLTQLLKSLHADKILYFDYQKDTWLWDLKQIQEQSVSDNVVELMIDKLQKLSPSTQQTLQLAACVGNQFDLHTLATVSSNTTEQAMQDIWDALQLNLIVPLNQDYRLFRHNQIDTQLTDINYQKNVNTKFRFQCDRIQQATYDLIPQSRKQKNHWEIGELLLKNIVDEDLESHIFELVNHLNAGLEMLSTDDETTESTKLEIARLNLIAGRKAKAIAAYNMALKYLDIGISLVDDTIWQSDYKLVFSLYETATEAAYLCAEYDLVEIFSAQVIANAKIPLETVKVYEIIIQASTAQNKPLQAVRIARQAVQKFGVILPEQVTTDDINQYLQVIAKQLACEAQGKKIEDLANLPKMENPNHLAVIQLLSGVILSAYISDSMLAHLITLKQVELLIKFGNAPSAAFCYACYGMLLITIRQDIETADKFGKLALALAAKTDSHVIKSMTYYVVGAFINHGKTHIKDSLPIFQNGYQAGLEGGNSEFIGYCIREICHYLYLMGTELTVVAQKLDYIPQVLANLNQARTLYNYQIIWQVVQNWLDKSENPCILQGEACDENKLLPILQSANEIEGLFHFYLNKLILCYAFYDYKQALEMANQTRKYLTGGLSFSSVPVFYFYDSLAILANYQQDNSEIEYLLAQVSENQIILQKWAENAPMNYQHKYDLIVAEKCRVLGHKYQAMDYYDRAIALAQENGYIQDVALANERAGQFYLALSKPKIAQAYIWEAYNRYMHWGAKAKINQLEKIYPQIIQRELEKGKRQSQSTLTNTKGSTTTSQQVLDLTTVIKASQAISSEIVLDKLLYNLLHIILENSSAQKGCIILEREGQLFIEAIDNDDNRHDIQLKTQKVDSSEYVPIAAINYVLRTHQSLVLGNANQEGIVQTDSYIVRQQTKSLLCAPIVYQGKFVGIVYLENNLVTNAFTKDRLQIIQVLTSQAATAIENAKLFAREQEKSQQLTRYLAQLAQQEEQYRGIFENTIDGLTVCDLETGQFIAVNQATIQMYGYTNEEWLNLQPKDFIHPDYLHCFGEFIETVKSGKEFFREVVTITKDGSLLDVEVKANGIQYNGKLHALSVTRDITDRKRAENFLKQERKNLEIALDKLQRTQSQLVQTEKISQLGQLVAGVAHEVNNPVGFINGNLAHAKQYVEDLINLVNLYQEKFSEPGIEITAEIENIDLDFLKQDLLKMISSMKLGTDRIRDIMRSLRNFSRADASEKHLVNIHENIDTTLIVLSHRIKHKPERPAIQIIKEYGDIPLLKCFSGQINQVLMNLLANAIDALDEANVGKTYQEIEKNPNIIKITTSVTDNFLTLRIADNGSGMTEAVCQKLFAAFFTTKPEGKGTGLGLSISYQIIVEAHGGKLECFSSPGNGAEFVIQLPI